MADVFISYSSKDRSIVEKTDAALQKAGLSTWWDTSLTPAEDWNKTIEHEIENAKVVLVLWTENSINSRWVQTEVDYALEKNKLVHVKFDSSSTPLMVRLIQHADLIDWDGDENNTAWQRTLGWIKQIKAGDIPDRKQTPSAHSENFKPKKTIEYPERVVNFDRTFLGSEEEQKLAEEYKSLVGNAYTKEFKSEHTIPYPIDFVWNVIKSTEYLGYWLQGNYENGRGYNDNIRAENWPTSMYDYSMAGGSWNGIDQPLPETFGRGTILSIPEYSANKPLPFLAYFWEDKKTIEFRYGNYFTLTLERMPSINECNLKICEFNFFKRPEGFWDRIKFDKKHPNTTSSVSDTLTLSCLGPRELKKQHEFATYRLNNILFDIDKFGHFITQLDVEHRWIEWGIGNDWPEKVLRLYSEEDGVPILSIGKIIKEEQKWGYTHPVGDETDKVPCMEWTGDWEVKEVYKKDGDMVKSGDKIALLEYIPNSSS